MTWTKENGKLQDARNLQLTQWVDNNLQPMPIYNQDKINDLIANIPDLMKHYADYAQSESNTLMQMADMDYDMAKRDSPLSVNKRLAKSVQGIDRQLKKQAKAISDQIYNSGHEVLQVAIDKINSNTDQLQAIKDQADNQRIHEKESAIFTLMQKDGYEQQDIMEFLTSAPGSRLVNNKTSHVDQLPDFLNEWEHLKIQQAEQQKEFAKQQAELQAKQVRTSGKLITKTIEIDESYLPQVKAYIESLGGHIK